MNRGQRRAFLEAFLGGLGAVALGPWNGGCSTPQVGAPQASSPQVAASQTAPSALPDGIPVDIRVDASFARLILSEPNGPELRAKLLRHGALEAIVRHQQLSGNQKARPESVLDRILDSVTRERPSALALDKWVGREVDLATCAHGASALLPASVRLEGTIYLVVGYDIGVAAPPDIVLNVAHEHFLKAPSEVGYYAIHEAHHTGFLALRPPPPFQRLNDPRELRSLIGYMTHLEGMGVHAAFDRRRSEGALGADGDYQVYADAAAARRVTARYAELTAKVSGETLLSDEEVGAILGAMSSGERVWYQFGALACSALEREQGRGALVSSILHPELFEESVARLLATLAHDPPNPR